MRTWSLEEVREVLSAPHAMSFFERWIAATGARDRLLERLEDVRTQGVTAMGRAKLADERARGHLDLAEKQRRRVTLAGPEAGPVKLEAEALEGAALDDARRDQHEAQERRRRADLLEGDARLLREELDAALRSLDRLWGEAGALGAHVGESCLFFPSAEVEGGHFVVPLVALTLGSDRLEACVLHRLAPGVPLARAVPVRDVPEADGEGRSVDPFDAPRERR